MQVVEERFPGELQTLRADNVRLRRLLVPSNEQARAADPDQATLTGAPTAPVDMHRMSRREARRDRHRDPRRIQLCRAGTVRGSPTCRHYVLPSPLKGAQSVGANLGKPAPHP